MTSFPNTIRAISTRYVSLRAGLAGPNSVATTCPDYDDMLSKWELIDDLLGGTEVMRSKSVRWLPKEPREEVSQYRNRLVRSFLYNALRDTIKRLSAKPFSQPVSLRGEIGDTRLEFLEQDVDGEGTDLTQFCKRLFEFGLRYGKAHIRTDFTNTGGAQSVAEEQTGQARPYMFAVDPRDVIGWKSEGPEGARELTQVRIRRTVRVPVGEYGEKDQEEILVMMPGQWEVHTLNEQGQWAKTSEGAYTIDKIPFITIYFDKTGFLTAEPPLMDLAEMNLCHWQSSSDHRNNLRFLRLGMLSAVGLSADEMEGEQSITIAPYTLLKSMNPNARFAYVESTGTAAKIGQDDLNHLEAQMEVLGLRPLVERSSDSTATGKALDETSTETEIQRWVRAVEMGVLAGYEMCAEWVGSEVPDDFAVEIFDDFNIISGSGEDKALLLQMRTAGEITRVTFLSEMKRRGVFADNFEPEEEATEAEADFSASFGDLNGNGEPGTGEEGDPTRDPAGEIQEGSSQKGRRVPPFIGAAKGR